MGPFLAAMANRAQDEEPSTLCNGGLQAALVTAQPRSLRTTAS